MLLLLLLSTAAEGGVLEERGIQLLSHFFTYSVLRRDIKKEPTDERDTEIWPRPVQANLFFGQSKENEGYLSFAYCGEQLGDTEFRCFSLLGGISVEHCLLLKE